MIPRIIHQTWKTSEVPPRLEAFAAGWRRLHPQWEYRLWTDATARDLVATEFPHLLQQYDSYPHNIQRVDVARLLFLIKHGGLYVDLDFEPLRSLDELLADCVVLLSEESSVDARRVGKKLLVSNAIIASEPNAEFLHHAIRQLPRRWPKSWSNMNVFDTILNTTGPYQLTRAYETFPGSVKLLDEVPFFCVGLQASRAAIDRRQLLERGAYAIHHFESSWHPK